MIKPSVKTTEVLEKAPAAKTLRNRWISKNYPNGTVNTCYKKVPKQFFGKRLKDK
jgi:hypothetical protein